MIDDLSFEYDYDEKIRAPRMSVMSLFRPHTNHSKTSSSTLDSSEKDTSLPDYKPADYELMGTRR
ncbi:DEKNAAC104586, partial [Brettanomyces naardenensis]